MISVHILCSNDCFTTIIMPQLTETTQFIFGQPLKPVLTVLTETQEGIGSERHHTQMVVAILRHIVSENLTLAAAIFACFTITAAADRREGWLTATLRLTYAALTINRH